MIVRRCPKCGEKYHYLHGEADPHKCTMGQWPKLEPVDAARPAGWSEERKAKQRAVMLAYHERRKAGANARADSSAADTSLEKSDT